MTFTFTILAAIVLVVVTLGFIGYMITTNSIIHSQEQIIRSQEQEIRELRTASVRSDHRRDRNEVNFGDF